MSLVEAVFLMEEEVERIAGESADGARENESASPSANNSSDAHQSTPQGSQTSPFLLTFHSKACSSSTLASEPRMGLPRGLERSKVRE